jgi:GNAT superfamily N-acetyltransferase
MRKPLQIIRLTDDEKAWAASVLTDSWGSPVIVARGRVYQADELPGFIAVQKGEPVGLITYSLNDKECEITTMNSLVEGKGIGSALVEAVKSIAVASKCRRLYLITTNDNTKALRWWQKRGFTFKAIYPGAAEKWHLLKLEIPLTGNDGIPIRDEIELEIIL